MENDDDEIRAPDMVIREQLVIPTIIPSDIPEKIIEESIREYKTWIQHQQQEEDILRVSREEYDLQIFQQIQEQEELERQLEEETIRVMVEEFEHLETIRKNIMERKNKCTDIIRRIENISMTVDGKHIQSILQPIIEHYIETSTILSPIQDPMIKQFLDELYTIPHNKGRKTAISKEIYDLFT